MYKIINAEEKHLDQIVPLLETTGYWEAGVKNNIIGLSAHNFMREYVAKPHLPFTTIAVKNDDHNTVLGVIVCASNSDLAQIPDHSPFMEPRIAKLFANFASFNMPDCFHISFLAVAKEFRGKGIGRKLMSLAEEKAKQAGYSTLSLFAFSCLTSAIRLYINMGMMITHTFTLSDSLLFPAVLYFEKSQKLASLHNYFETKEYKDLLL